MNPLRRMLSIGRRGGMRLDSASLAAAVPDTAGAAGLNMKSLPGGRLEVSLERIELRNLQLQAGEFAVAVALAHLQGATLELGPSESGTAFELLGLAADELRLQGLQVKATGAFSCSLPPPGTWRLDAVAGMEGRLHAFITNAAWIIDAGVNIQVSQGRIDFNRVGVEHIGPNSSMGISPAGVYIDAPHGGRNFLVLFTGGTPVPGVRFEQRDSGRRSRITDRGMLELQAFMEGLLGSIGSGSPWGRAADRHVEATLDRTRLDGELQFGDGPLGTERHRLVLQGQAEGRNKARFSAAVLSHKLVLRMPELSARGARFELFGQSGSTGPITACLEVEATELRGSQAPDVCGPALRLDAEQLSVSRIAMGTLAPAEEDGQPQASGP